MGRGVSLGLWKNRKGFLKYKDEGKKKGLWGCSNGSSSEVKG